MRYKRLVRIILCSSLLLFAAQFAIFRIRGVFDLALLSCLYDNASWVTEKPRVLLMGSSRCFHQLVPSVIADLNGLGSTDVANIGQVAAGPFEMLHTYTKHIDLLDEAEFVFYVLDADFFFESSHVDSPYERILLDRKQWDLISGVHGNFYHLPAVLFANAIRGSPRKTGAEMGFEGLPHMDFLNMTFEDRDRPFRLDLENFPLSDFQVGSMRRIKELCEAYGGILVFVLTPFWDIGSLEDEFFDRTDILVRALDDALGPTRLVGSWEREEYGLEYEDFLDNSHLSASGSEKVTPLIFGDIESIRSQRPAMLSGRVPAGATKRANRN
ncbi:MAG: hypothetical protein GX181_07625 [Synergistaceae bacterium]|nr:hypothetical protein [Synergistota bacterium]NLM71810.1 hypothetical protein [Synergistaceae bacterium]